MSKQVVGSMSEWSGVLKDFFRQIDDGSITIPMVQALLEHRVEVNVKALLEDWDRFWNRFGFTVGDVTVPEKRSGFDRLLVIPKGLTIEQAYQLCKKMFKCWRYTNQNLDEAISINDRMPTEKSYAIWIRERVEADEEFKNKSANQLKAEGHNGITVLERLVFEMKYFDETKKHLDISNWTLCSGSRSIGGNVPNVYWYGNDDKLSVDYYSPGNAYDDLRSREVVSN